MDDIDPARNAGHAAILRSPFAHARIVRLDASAALEHPGVIGVLTGADVAAMSNPFPVGVENAPPYYAAAHEVARYAGEPLAVVVARDRYTAEDALELIEVEYEPLDAGARSRGRRGRLRPLLLVRRPRRGVRRRGSRRRGALRLPALDCVPDRVLRRRRGLERGDRRADGVGELPGPVHAALGRGGRARAEGLEAAADHAAELGRELRDQGHGLRLRRPDRPRLAQARRARSLDRGPAGAPRGQLGLDRARHRASRRRSRPTASFSRSATTRSRTWARTSARPSRPASTACTAR